MLIDKQIIRPKTDLVALVTVLTDLPYGIVHKRNSCCQILERLAASEHSFCYLLKK